MNNELATQSIQSVQQELRLVKQENEIMSLRQQLQKAQAEKSSRLEDSLFAPSLYEHYQKVAQTLSKSSVIPTAYRGKPEDIFVAMAMGYQLGFPVEQSLQDVAVINGRPCLWGDGLLSLVLNHAQCEDIKEEPIYSGSIVTGYICTVKRRGHEPHSKTFTIQDAERAGLLKKGGVWTAYPERMLQMRARALALRDKFADALRGLRVAEVEQDDATIIEGEVIPNTRVTPAINQVDKLKNILENKQAVVVDVSEMEEKPEEKPIAQPKEEPKIPDDETPISQENIDKIEILMDEKGFEDVRKQKAFDYFKIKKLSDLTEAQAKIFLLQLGKP